MKELRGTARLTGLFYLGLAITGGLGFLIVRPAIFDSGDPATTLQNLVDHLGLARFGITLELGVVLTQALAAIWFYRLFRSVNTFSAGAIAAFGLVNAMAILVSAGLLQMSAEIAQVSVSVADPAGSVQLAYTLSADIWNVAGLFFGLWLIPMGWLVLRSRWMPGLLGWVLIVGGVGYVLSSFVAALTTGTETLVTVLTLPATVGEFWMIGYLLIFGVNKGAEPGTA